MRRSTIIGCMVAAVAVLGGCGGGGGVSPNQVATAAGAQSCDVSGYQIISKLNGSKDTIYDCTFSSGAVKCVTYANGVANDSTATVRLLFVTKLGLGRPSCLG